MSVIKPQNYSKKITYVSNQGTFQLILAKIMSSVQQSDYLFMMDAFTLQIVVNPVLGDDELM